jgi:hypothetical protein
VVSPESPDGADRSPPEAFAEDAAGSARHRYGIVLGLTVLAVLFSILAPETPLGRAIAVLLQGTVLLAVIGTARDRRTTRGAAGGAVIAAIAALALLVGFGVVPRWVGAAASAVAVFAVLVVLLRGIVQLIREQGVTVRAVAGALTTYLLIGLEFALVTRVAVGLSAHQYFEQVSNAAATQSEELYFSFTTLTTTGYGDLTPAVSAGRALSVLEMLIGQIYLVTVIGLLVGNLHRGSRRPAEG